MASKLRHYRGRPDVVVLALPRGGVPVAYEVARALRAPLRVLVVRKIGVPGNPEFGVGAVTAHGAPVYAEASLRALGLTTHDLDREAMRRRAEVRSRVQRYAQEPIPLEGRDVIMCDDGLATGVTARAALRDAREQRPRTLVFAAPVCAPGATGSLHTADRIECLARPAPFRAVCQFYLDFHQTTDDEVRALLDAAERELARHRR